MKECRVVSSLALALAFIGSQTQALAQDQPDPEVIQQRDAVEVSYSKDQTALTNAYLNQRPELRKKIQERAAALAPQNAPLVTDLYGMRFKIDSGSLIQLGADGTVARTVVDGKSLPKGSAIVFYTVSPDQAKMAYGYSVGGSDWSTWNVISLADLSQVDGPFHLKTTALEDEPHWSGDSAGFYYSNNTTATDDFKGNHAPSLKYHALKTPVTADPVLFDDGEHATKYAARELANGDLLVYRTLLGAEIPMTLYLLKSVGPHQFAKPVEVVPPNRYVGHILGISGRKVYARTAKLGPHYSVIAIDLASAGASGRGRFVQTVIVPSSKDKVLAFAAMLGNRLVLQYLNTHLEASSEVRDLSGALLGIFKPSDFGYPDWGQLGAPTGDTSTSASASFTYSSVNMPTESFRIDLASGEFTMTPGKTVNFDGSKVKASLVRFKSADGTAEIPMWVYARNDGSTPSFGYLSAYGAIGTGNVPSWNKKYELVLELGGVVALPAARGGGEFGLDWQRSGTTRGMRPSGNPEDNRVNTFSDIALASAKLKELYPSVAGKVIRTGRSYGGGFTLAQYGLNNADFDAYIAVVPAADIIREWFQGVEWVHLDDFGTPRDERGRLIPKYLTKESCVIRNWNPIDVVTRAQTPKPLLVFVAENDTRVTASAGIQTVMKLKAAFPEAPIYLYEHSGVGHMGRAEFAEEGAYISQLYGVQDVAPLTK